MQELIYQHEALNLKTQQRRDSEMETTTKKTSQSVLKLALLILNRHRRSFEMYEEECKDYAKQGFAPHYCVHGTNLWVDWDCACGMCEEYGGYWDYALYARFSLDEALRAHEQQDERIDILVKLMTMGAPVQIAELGKWATEPVQKYFPKEEQKEGYAALAKCDPPF